MNEFKEAILVIDDVSKIQEGMIGKFTKSSLKLKIIPYLVDTSKTKNKTICDISQIINKNNVTHIITDRSFAVIDDSPKDKAIFRKANGINFNQVDEIIADIVNQLDSALIKKIRSFIIYSYDPYSKSIRRDFRNLRENLSKVVANKLRVDVKAVLDKIKTIEASSIYRRPGKTGIYPNGFEAKCLVGSYDACSFYGEFLADVLINIIENEKKSDIERINPYSYSKPQNYEMLKHIRSLEDLITNKHLSIGSVSCFGNLYGREEYLVDVPYKNYFKAINEEIARVSDEDKKQDLSILFYENQNKNKGFAKYEYVCFNYAVYEDDRLLLKHIKLSDRLKDCESICNKWLPLLHTSIFYCKEDSWKKDLLDCNSKSTKEPVSIITLLFSILKLDENDFHGTFNFTLYSENPQASNESMELLAYEKYAPILESKLLELILPHKSKEVKRQALKTANISILIDSFAHNMGAHSLVALSNYFANRKNLLEKRTILNDVSYHNSLNKAVLKSEITSLFNIANDENKEFTGQDLKPENLISLSDIIKYGSNEWLNKLLHFKQSGVGAALADINLPVPIDDNIYTFIKYLTEKSEFWSAVIAGETFNSSIITAFELIWGFVDNPLFVGTLDASEKIHKVKIIVNGQNFALIDFSAIDAKGIEGDYQFIKLLEGFTSLRESLSKQDIWLPGGNVGKQSVYTILENCLRNIKHYDIFKIGGEISLHIKIKEDKNETYCFETYLGSSFYLNGNTGSSIVDRIKKQLDKGTYDFQENKPIMGGTSQSILCANHLFTGNFSNAENKCECFIVDLEGEFVKYVFKAWQGGGVKEINDTTYLSGSTSVSRYKFLTAKCSSNLLDIVRRNQSDAIRIVKTDKDNEQEIYSDWLASWLTTNQSKGIKLCFDGHEFTTDETNFVKTIKFAHSEDNSTQLEYRNHGVFIKNIKDNWKKLKYDVTEAMLSGVFAIDNRLYNVVKGKNNISVIENELNLYIKEEDEESINNKELVLLLNSESIINEKINFLIIHLSFIESISNGCYKNDINAFLAKVNTALNGRKNFHLIITTGRGRTDWYESISEEYRHLCKYRSILSLQNALQNAVMTKDDFDLKYNLIKVLFGT